MVSKVIVLVIFQVKHESVKGKQQFLKSIITQN